MNPMQALQFLDSAVAKMDGDRTAHSNAMQAVAVIRAALAKVEKVGNEKKEELPKSEAADKGPAPELPAGNA